MDRHEVSAFNLPAQVPSGTVLGPFNTVERIRPKSGEHMIFDGDAPRALFIEVNYEQFQAGSLALSIDGGRPAEFTFTYTDFYHPERIDKRETYMLVVEPAKSLRIMSMSSNIYLRGIHRRE